MAQAKSIRDTLRSKVLGTKGGFKETTVEYDGETFYLRSMTLGERQELLSRAQNDNGEGVNMTAFLLLSIITVVRDENGDKVFDYADYDVFMNMPANHPFIETFSKAVTDLMGN